MSNIKLPSLDKTQSALIIVGAMIVGYLAYRLYSAGDTIAGAVKRNVSGVVDLATDVGHTVNIAATNVGAKTRAILNGGDAPVDPAHQSNAETERLKRQANPQTYLVPEDLENYNYMGMEDAFVSSRPDFSPESIYYP